MNKEEERKRIGQSIAALRKIIKWVDANGYRRTGMTQGELAERCGIAQSHIARIEAGRYSVGFDTLQQIADAMGCDIEIVERPIEWKLKRIRINHDKTVDMEAESKSGTMKINGCLLHIEENNEESNEDGVFDYIQI